MKEKDKNKTGRSEFLRYISGDIADGERNAFEREHEKDPFAAEAAEGLQKFLSSDTQKDLIDLQSRLERRISGRKRIAYYSIAASVAVLMILSSVFIIVQKNKTPVASAEEEKTPVILEIAESKAVAEPAIMDREDQTVSGIKEAVQDRQTVTEQEKSEVRVMEQAVPKADMKKPVDLIMAEYKVTDQVVAGAERAASVQSAVAGVSLQSRAAMDSDLSMLDEVIVVGYGTSQKNENKFTGYSPPVPVGGKSDFEKYISENIRKPSTLTEGERAFVVMGILVKSSGAIDSLRIIRSPGLEFSEEAKRLIREGPSWKPAESNGIKIDDEIRVRIIFK